MVLGLRAKAKKSASVRLHYLIHLQEIKPWPPSQSLRSLRSVLIQWENGEKNCGSTSSVVPSVGSGAGDGKIEFNESFRLTVTLLRDSSVKAGDGDTFQKNCLEFHLYEPRRDKTLKGQLLGTATVDLANLGIIKETTTVTAQMNCQRNFRNTAQPLLYAKIQPIDRGSLSLKERFEMKESLDRNGAESVSALMREEYAEEAEMTSFTDDDASSHSSTTISCSPLRSDSILPPQKEERGSDATDKIIERGDEEHIAASEPEVEVRRSDVKSSVAQAENFVRSSSHSSSMDLSSEPGCSDNGNASSSTSSPRSSSKVITQASGHSAWSSSSSLVIQQTNEDSSISCGAKSSTEDACERGTCGESKVGGNSLLNSKDIEVICAEVASFRQNSVNMSDVNAWVTEDDNGECLQAEQDNLEEKSPEYETGHSEHASTQEKGKSIEDDPADTFSYDATTEQSILVNGALLSGENHWMKGNIVVIDRLKHAKSVRSPADTSRSSGVASAKLLAGDVKEKGVTLNRPRSFGGNEKRDASSYGKDTRSAFLEAKVKQLESQIQALEGELTEVAAIEVAFFSVVAEHGSSKVKVHAPARRLSRFYIHACKDPSQSRRASAAKSAVSGLVLVAKACGNDVPRLTFWLSNCIILRTIISEMIENTNIPFSPVVQYGGSCAGKGNGEVPLSLKWKKSSSRRNSNTNVGTICDWEDPCIFVSALEKVEAWIFSRAIESIWWQTFTPYMQSATSKDADNMDSSSNQRNRTETHEDVQDHEDISLDLWKKAFKDACERLCPIRAGGHECGCLPMLARMVMKQCVARLDVGMFNAIIREAADDILSDPVSDPISDSKVLPIPAGQSSFGIGAQLKNVIGNWSRWLTDLFGMDDENSSGDENENVDDERKDGSFKSFHLLNALSDLMMLPKDMLLCGSIRKEVCPMFSTSLIKRVLKNFAPDEFCPDPIPDVVLEALESEDEALGGDESTGIYPYVAVPAVYTPPPVTSVIGMIGEIGATPELIRSESSVLRKLHTSYDELDELKSPFASILIDDPQSSPISTKPCWITKQRGQRNCIRYELLRNVWMNSE